MGTLHRYILKQSAATLAMTVVVFTGVLLLGSVLKDVLSMLAAGNLSINQVARAILLLVPFVLAFSLPVGMLTASLLVFGRLSADQEITAARAGGWSLVALAAPVLGLSALMCLFCGWFNTQIAPQCRVAFKELEREAIGLTAAGQNSPLVTEGQYVERGSFSIYARKTWSNRMEDVLIYQIKNGRRLLDARALSGESIVSPDGQSMELVLREVQGMMVQGSNDFKLWPFYHQEVRTNMSLAAIGASMKPKYSDMTFGQLWAERREIRARGGRPSPVVMQLHRQIAFSFACFGFTMVGIPLGLRGHRRETNFGVGIALVLMLLYYSFIILGQAMETRAELYPHLILWVPNFIFIGVGAWMMSRMDRAGK